MFKKISLWYHFEGKFLFRNLKQGIRNLWYWAPVIYKDRNWDSNYIYEIIKHKLKSQALYIGVTDRHTSAQLDSKRMIICSNLIQKLQDEFYQMEYSDYSEYKYWFEDCKDQPGYSTWEKELIWEKYDEYFKKYPLIYLRVLNGEGMFSLKDREPGEIKNLIAMNIGHINHNRARKLLFKIMEENIEGWWD